MLQELRSLKSAIKKLTYSKERKMMAGNQLNNYEKSALISAAALLLGPLMITGIIVLLHEINLAI